MELRGVVRCVSRHAPSVRSGAFAWSCALRSTLLSCLVAEPMVSTSRQSNLARVPMWAMGLTTARADCTVQLRWALRLWAPNCIASPNTG